MDPLFTGTLHFARIVFFIESENRQSSVSDADMQVIVQYTQKIIRPITLYASQYGYTYLAVDPTVIEANVAISDKSFDDGSMKDWVLDIAAAHGIPDGDCIVIPFPGELTNSSWDGGTRGYHYAGDLNYILSVVSASGLTVQDTPWNFAGHLSHEIAEMTVNPTGNNPEVCDPCGPNHVSTYIDYFDVQGNYIQTTQTPPYNVNFAYDFYINGIVQPSHSSDEVAPAWACSYAPPLPSGKQITIGQNDDGRLEVFYTTMANEIYHLWQVAPNIGWRNPMPLGSESFAVQLAVTKNAAGELVCVYRGTNQQVYYDFQTTKNGNWNGETSIGDNDLCLQVTTAVFSTGELGVFYVGTNHQLYYNWQTDGIHWNGETHFGDSGHQVAVAKNLDGTMEVFYIGMDQLVYHNRQIGDVTQWSGPQPLGGPAVQVVAGQNGDGRLEIFFIGTDQQIYHNWQTTPFDPSADWNGVVALGGSAIQLALGNNEDGRLELFYIGTGNNYLYHNWKLPVTGNWYGEAALGGAAFEICVDSNQDGRLELYYVGTNFVIYHNWQTEKNGNWFGEVSL